MNPYLKHYVLKRTIERPRYHPDPILIVPATVEVEQVQEPLSKSLQILLNNIDGFDYIHHRDWRPLMRDLTKAVFPNLLANHTVGVQPFSAHEGQVYRLLTKSVPYEAPPDAYFYQPPTTRYQITIEKFPSFTRNMRLATRYEFPAGDSEAEMIKSIAKETIAELDNEILLHLHIIAGEPSFHSTSKILDRTHFASTSTNPDFRLSELGFNIRRAASKIAMDTHRCAGNFCVVSGYALSLLKQGCDFKPEENINTLAATPLVGTLNNAIKVFHNPWLAPTKPVLVGYKGNGNEIDAGYFYSPYALGIPSGMIIDPNTFEPIMAFRTQRATLSFKKSEESQFESSDYFKTVDIQDA